MLFLNLMLMEDGSRLNLAGTLNRIVLLFLAYIGFSLLQRFMARSRLLRSISLQLNVLVLSLLATLFLAPVLSRMNPYVGNGLLALAAFLCVTISLRFMDFLLFELIARWRRQTQVPLVLRDIGRWVGSLLSLVLIVKYFFPGVNLNVLAVSSIVVGYILGNATQDTLGNLFAGLALNTESPFQIGDWVTVNGHTGMVVDTTWRATRLRTKTEDFIIIPNAAIAKEPIVNYSRPTHCHGCYLTIGTSYDCPPNKVRDTILGVLKDAPDVLADPPPSVYLSGYGDFAITFTVKFFIQDYSRLDPIHSLVMDRLWYAFKREGIGIPYPIREIHTTESNDTRQRIAAARRACALARLRGIELFASLSPAELERLADAARAIPYATGETLCRQGDEGDSFYVIQSGRIRISVEGADHAPVPVATLETGAFFGEMSLLTGEPRSATATADTDVDVLCLAKQDFAGVLQADALLAGKLAAVLEKRSAERQARMTTSAPTESAPVTQSSLAARIRRFFDLA